MSVVFKSRQKFYDVPHDNLFHVGVQIELYQYSETQGKKICIATEEELTERAKLPAPEMVNRSYCFMEGEDHNLLTLSREDEIEAMRAYASTSSGMIVELDPEGNEPADPEGTPFIADIAGFVLTPAMYMGNTGAQGKTYIFSMGAERNKYITADQEEISILRSYVRNNQNCDIKDPTYVNPLA